MPRLGVRICVVVVGMLLSTVVLAGCGPQSPPETGSTASPSPSPLPHVLWESDAVAGPTDVMAAFGSIWVANRHASSVSRIDPTTNKIIATIATGNQPGALFQGLSAVWTFSDGTLFRIDPHGNKATSFEEPDVCGQPAFVGEKIWAFDCQGDHIIRVNAKTGDHKVIMAALPYFASFFLNSGTLWLAASNPGQLMAIDPVTRKVRSRIDLPGCPNFNRVSLIDGSLWIGQVDDCPGGDSDAVLKVDPTTGRIQSTIHTKLVAPGIVAAGSRSWIYDASGKIETLDPSTGALSPYADLHSSGVYTVEAGYGSLWAVSYIDSKIWRLAQR